MSVLYKSLNLIDDIINESEARDIDFYPSILKMMLSVFSDCFIGIYFLENTKYEFKGAIKEGKLLTKNPNINFDNLQNFLNSKETYLTYQTSNDKTLYKNNIVVKLSIRSSVFGFCLLSLNENITKEISKAFISIINAISYKIKDYELSQVFKIQLKALQEAILEKQTAYEIIEKQHKKLKELDKTKNLFLANISHDLRTPLNAIIGFSQALDSKIFGELNEKQSEYIKDIQISGLHLLGMINEILDISKLEAHSMKFNPTELSPNQVIKEAINILEPLFSNKNLKVQFNSKFDGSIKADYQKMQQILFNLLSNAIKFTQDGGKITIESYAKDNKYYLKVKDNGIGIEKKNHAKIFKKFVHLSNVYTKSQNSTGLGLTITKELVKLHNGKISLESELNKGATFTMEFNDIIV